MTTPRDPDADDLVPLAVGLLAALITAVGTVLWIRRRLW